MTNSFLVFSCFRYSCLATSHVAFFVLRGLLGPFWRVLPRTLLYIPMSFLLLNDINDLLFQTANDLQDSQTCTTVHLCH